MSDDIGRKARHSLRQRLESLQRAGLDRVPIHWPEGLDLSSPRRPTSERPTTTSSTGVAARPPERSDTPAAPVSPARPSVRPEKPASPTIETVIAATGSLFGHEGYDEPLIPPEERLAILESERAVVASCVRCPHLAATRTQTVYGVGNPQARLMFIGEAPGADEDRLGEPFVGRAGQLLTDMITKGMGIQRADVYIANILKCRPPNNRDPEPTEIANCIGYLERQIATIRPDYLCLLGRIAAQRLLDTAMPMSRLRGKWHRYRGIPTLVTYHPAYLLRNPAAKADAWEDLKMLMRAMGLKVPERGKKPPENQG